MNKITLGLLTVLLTVPSGSLEETKLVTGTVALLNDISKVTMIIAPLLGAATIGVFALIKTQAEENEQPMWKKRMMGVGIAVIVVFVVSGLITAITGYYK